MPLPALLVIVRSPVDLAGQIHSLFHDRLDDGVIHIEYILFASFVERPHPHYLVPVSLHFGFAYKIPSSTY